MFQALFAAFFSLTVFASNCDDLFNVRHESSQRATEALNCFAKTPGTTRLEKAHALSRMSYLKFYINEYYTESQREPLLDAITNAEDGILLFGTKYDVAAYSALPAPEKEELGWLLYNYGLTLSRYVDLSGPLEAIRRMEDIKKSMNTIIRMKEESVSFYGAHRTLGIFHFKVPAIAGGDIKLSEPYILKAINSTLAGTVSAFPGNNVALGELYVKLNQDAKACAQFALVANLSENDIARLSNGHILETRQSIKKARDLGQKCR